VEAFVVNGADEAGKGVVVVISGDGDDVNTGVQKRPKTAL
jgi:hypothetical protein